MAKRFGLLNLAVPDPNPFEIVGENNVGREFAIAPELIRLEDLCKIFADGFRLDITEDGAGLHDLEVRRALLRNALRLMLDIDVVPGTGGEYIQQHLHGRTVGVLGLVWNRRLPKRLEIFREDFLDQDIPSHPRPLS
ncbi:MAG TPA: hypothetical protein VHY79_12060 [Rhizomicrobium sp.]|nr:hypothetical protein [Rhizomicrobium sp.]